ncbi:MAG: chloride channel protein [Elusimicrobia bacterium]|nr:chloride channel protein [Elusimicrobiota bacterium]
MKTHITESTLLFISIVKWVFLATLAGTIVGFPTALFLKYLRITSDWASGWEYYYLLLPVAMFASAALVKYLAPEAKGHGTEKVIESIHRRAGRIPLAVVPVKLVATLITLALGGSAGKEGPCAQIGAGITSAFSQLFQFNDHDRQKLVICGISAGFAAVFGTPIAGAIFGVEVLFVGSILYEVLLPSFISGITAYQISAAMGVSYFYRPLKFIPVFSETFMLKVMFAGVFCGLAAMILIETVSYFEKKAHDIKIWEPYRGLIGGTVIVALTLLVTKRYLGLGLDVIEDSLMGAPAHWYDFIMKSVFTGITLSFGGSGGIITPVFFVGTTAGSLYAGLLHLDHATFAAIGMTAVLAGAANTPIAASIMAVELFGPAVAPYATVACVISFLMTGNRSVYPSQVLSMMKSESVKGELGKELQQMRSTYSPRPGGLAALAIRFIQKVDDAVNSLRR